MSRFARSAGSPAATTGVLLVGCGYWGRNYVRIFDELPDAEVVAICDGSVDRLHTVGADYPSAFLTTSLDEALAHRDVEVAVVCTPAASHHAVASQCLRAGVHVLLEKPMTTRVDEADDLIRLSDETGATLMVGLTFLFNPGVHKVREYVRRGDAGRVYYLYAQRTSLGPIRSDVDALWDLAPHDISIFNCLLDAEPEWASAIGSNVLGSERADVGFITLGYPGGIVGHIHVSWADPNKVREVVLVGSDSRIVFNDTNPVERVRVFQKGVAATADPTTFGEFTFHVRDGDIVSPYIEAAEPLKTQCLAFLDCVRTSTTPASDGAFGRSVVSVMEAVDRSLAAGGRPIAITPSTASPVAA